MNEKKALRAGLTMKAKILKMSNTELMQFETGVMLLLTDVENELEKRGLPRKVEL